MSGPSLGPRLGIVCGMQTEFDALGRWAIDPKVVVAVSGARPDLAEDGARWLVEQGCTALLSWGVAGGLSADLAPGDIIAANDVVDEGGAHHPLTRIDLSSVEGAAPHEGSILGLDRMVFHSTEKAALHRISGAICVDMETHRVAKVAATHGLPAAALRVVGDGAGRSLPPFVANAITATGHRRIGPVLLGLLGSPGHLPGLLRLKKDTELALDRLRGMVEEGLFDRLMELSSQR